MFVLFRFPAPGKGEVNTTGYQCEVGFSAAVMVDVQRVFAALEVLRSETEPVDPPLDYAYLGTVGLASPSFSTQVVSPMTSQPEWRRITALR